MYKTGISIGMLFFQHKILVSVCYLILKIGISIGKVKSYKSVRIGIGKNRLKVNRYTVTYQPTQPPNRQSTHPLIRKSFEWVSENIRVTSKVAYLVKLGLYKLVG